MSKDFIHCEDDCQYDDDHSSLGKPFCVVAKLRNHRMIKAREDLGYKTCAEAARALGVDYHAMVNLEGLKDKPWTQAGDKPREWRKQALEIADALCYSPEELWPECIGMVASTVMRVEIDHPAAPTAIPGTDEMASKLELEADVRAVVSELNPRHARIIRMSFGLDGGEEFTINEMAKIERISVERIRQIRAIAIRRLSRVRKLSGHTDHHSYDEGEEG